MNSTGVQRGTAVDIRFFINIFYSTEFKNGCCGFHNDQPVTFKRPLVARAGSGGLCSTRSLEVGLILGQRQLPRDVARGDGTLCRNVRNLAGGAATDEGEEKNSEETVFIVYKAYRTL